jgi:hypothetical protein
MDYLYLVIYAIYYLIWKLHNSEICYLHLSELSFQSPSGFERIFYFWMPIYYQFYLFITNLASFVSVSRVISTWNQTNEFVYFCSYMFNSCFFLLLFRRNIISLEMFLETAYAIKFYQEDFVNWSLKHFLCWR